MVPSQQNYNATPQTIIPSSLHNERPIPEEKPQKSESTIYSVIFIITALVLGAVAVIPGLSAVGFLAVVSGLAAVLMGILSLREIL